jgi:hypothetical protein
MLTGRIILESLRVGSELRVPGLVTTWIGRQDVSSSTAPFQPDVWTLLDFEAPDESYDTLVDGLAGALVAGQGWYADFRVRANEGANVGDDHVVVYPGRVFRYRVGDAAGRAEAMEYGRKEGIPENQLDWDG